MTDIPKGRIHKGLIYNSRTGNYVKHDRPSDRLYQSNNFEIRWTDLNLLIGLDRIHFSHGANILDIGIHRGYVTRKLIDKLEEIPIVNCKYLGIENQKVLLNKAKEFLLNEIQYKEINIFDYDIPRDYFSHIFCLGVLHKASIEAQKKLLTKLLEAGAKQVVLRTQLECCTNILEAAKYWQYSTLIFEGNSGQGWIYILDKIPYQWPPN